MGGGVGINSLAGFSRHGFHSLMSCGLRYLRMSVELEVGVGGLWRRGSARSEGF